MSDLFDGPKGQRNFLRVDRLNRVLRTHFDRELLTQLRTSTDVRCLHCV